MTIINKIRNKIRNYYRWVFLGDKFLPEVKRWRKEQSNGNLRLDYELDKSSIVFDVGGYEGSWASEVYQKFKSNIFIFEPVPEFAEDIKRKFIGNNKIQVLAYGLSDKNDKLSISLGGDNSSFYINSKNSTISAEIREFSYELLTLLGVETIDLMKINIEGGEYDLLEHMIDNGTIKLIKNLQIQFHNFVPNATARRSKIRQKLNLSHQETWCYEFVWENWLLNNSSKRK
ncbi:MAG: FkbM family methyltransferase [Methylotenera sp.]|nr:FkbM family methyltransferase [Methylotenera sp.]